MEIKKEIYSNGLLCKVVGTYKEIPQELITKIPEEFLDGKSILVNEAMPLGQEVRVVIGNQSTKGYVAKRVDNSHLVILKPNFESLCDRSYFRLNIQLNVQINTSIVASRNIGGGGLSFLIDDLQFSFPLGEMVEGSFEHPDGYLFLGTGKIIREDALEYTNLSERERGLLLNHLYSIQRKQTKGISFSK